MASNMSNIEAGLASAGMAFSTGAKAYVEATAGSAESSVEQPPNLTIGDEELITIATKTEENLGTLFSKFEGDTKIDWKGLKQDNTTQSLQSEVRRNLDNVKQCKSKDTNPVLANKVEIVLKQFMKLLVDFEMQAKSEPENVIDLHGDMEKVIGEATNLVATLNIALNVPLNKKAGPGAVKSTLGALSNKLAGKTSNLTEARLKMAHTKLEMMREQARQSQEQADKSMERQLESSRRLQQTLEQLTKFRAQEATQKAVLEMLIAGIKQFAELKAKWTQLLMFFTQMSNLVKVTLGKPLDSFVRHSQAIQDDMEDGHKISSVAIDQIYTPTYEAVKISYLVNNLATVYIDISKDYMMPQVAELTTLLALSSHEDKDTIGEKKDQLNKGALAMQKKIEQNVIERTKKCKADVDKRMKQIDTKFQDIFPQRISIEQKKAIKDKVQADVKEAKEYMSAPSASASSATALATEAFL